MSESYEEKRARWREEERRYESDVAYEVWRNGGNPDRIDPDRVQDSRYMGMDVDSAAHRELRRQRPREPEQQQEQEQPPIE